DAAAIDKTVQTYPMTKVYDLASALTSLGVGEAVVTVLSPAGGPTPAAWTRLSPPQPHTAPAAPAPPPGGGAPRPPPPGAPGRPPPTAHTSPPPPSSKRPRPTSRSPPQRRP